jgi:hypothetical protein
MINGQDIVTIYHKDTGAHELCAIDANDAVQRHPKEWSRKPWPGQKSGHGAARRVPAGGTQHGPEAA